MKYRLQKSSSGDLRVLREDGASVWLNPIIDWSGVDPSVDPYIQHKFDEIDKRKEVRDNQFSDLVKRMMAIPFLVMLCGCSPKPGSATSALTNQLNEVYLRNVDVSVFDFEGHRYMSRYHGGIVHAESCQCKRETGVVFRSYPHVLTK